MKRVEIKFTMNVPTEINVVQDIVLNICSGSDLYKEIVLVVTAVVLPLRDVEHVLWFWSVEHSSINRPQSTEDPEQRTLPTAVWTSDQHIHPFIHLKSHREHTFSKQRMKIKQRTS